MAAIAHKDAERYIARPDRAHFLFLVFGADQGLIIERSQGLLASIAKDRRQSAHLIDLSGDAIASDPLMLADEAHSIGLFDGPYRAIRISLGAKSILPALENIERSPPTDTTILLQAGELKRDAPIRRWVEKQSFGASIECAADDARDIQRLLDAELKRANLTIEPEARDILSEILGDDRLSTRSEMDKLVLYAQGQTIITVNHVNELLLDATAVNLDALMSAIFSGQSERIIELTSKLSIADIDINRMSATALRYALAIQRARAEMDDGASAEDSLQTLLRQLNGYKRKAEIAATLSHSQLEKTTSFVEAIYNALKATRKVNVLSDERFARLGLAIAGLTKRRPFK